MLARARGDVAVDDERATPSSRPAPPPPPLMRGHARDSPTSVPTPPAALHPRPLRSLRRPARGFPGVACFAAVGRPGGRAARALEWACRSKLTHKLDDCGRERSGQRCPPACLVGGVVQKPMDDDPGHNGSDDTKSRFRYRYTQML